MTTAVRVLAAERITAAVARLVQRVNVELPPDVTEALRAAAARETDPRTQRIMEELTENARVAGELGIPLCQDTGVAVFFVQWGQAVCLEGTSLQAAVDAGVRQGYRAGYLRQSVVDDPLERHNTGDNTPALIHLDSVPGTTVRIHFMPKGAGSENQSRLKMLTPAAGWAGIRDFVLETVRAGGASACPPLVVGVGVGGTFDSVTWLAKRALFRPLTERHPHPSWAERERELLAEVNALGIGPAGLGGCGTALAVAVETHPCHIASLPVAVNLQCHAARRGTVEV